MNAIVPKYGSVRCTPLWLSGGRCWKTAKSDETPRFQI